MDSRSSRYSFKSTKNFIGDFKPETSAFFRALELGHLVDEVWVPLTAQARTHAVVAIEERPWPPRGVGARTLRGLVQASLSDDGQAILTPPFLHPSHGSDIGLGAGLLKYLLDDLVEAKVPRLTLFADSRDKLLQVLLGDAGLANSAARVSADEREFSGFSAAPSDVRRNLGLEGSLRDVLELNAKHDDIRRWTAFVLGLSAAVRPYWDDELRRWTRIYPGLIDWAALPPGTITGTKGPDAPRPAEGT